jgi:hypothetical protein
MAPHVYLNKGRAGFETSGGAWCSVPLKDLKPEGLDKKRFWTWSSGGAGAGMGIYFYAEVKVWRYTDPANRFEGYSSEKFDRFQIWEKEKLTCPTDYKYTTDGKAWKTDKELQAWAQTFKAVSFPGYWNNDKVYFCYRAKSHRISREEWDALDLPKDTRQCNGVIDIKFKYDDENKIIHEYRYDNSGPWKNRQPYQYQLNKINK